MGKKAILCISDLHINRKTEKEDNPSLLDTNKTLIERIITVIKKHQYDVTHIIVLGDVANKGNKHEYIKAKEVLEDLMNQCGITDKEKIFIIPGNHDINWKKYEASIDEDDDPNAFEKAHEYQDYKLSEFKQFYDDFYDNKKSFDPNKEISDVVTLEEYGIALLGVNTLWHESYLMNDHYGYVDFDTLRSDLSSIKDSISNYTAIVLMHHMPGYKNDNQYYIRNWTQISELFSNNDIRIFIGGHAHFAESVASRTTEDRFFFLTGSLSSSEKNITNSFLVLEKGAERDKQGFHVKYFAKQDDHFKDGDSWYWQELSDKPDTIKFLPIQRMNGDNSFAESGLPFNSNNIEKQERKICSDYILNPEYLNSAQAIVYEVLKEQKLFQSGHFHWSKNGRSHSYIKTNYYFEKHDTFKKIKIAFINLIRERNINEKTDLLIGYAMQGNVLGTALAAALNLQYTYLPELNKKHPQYEKVLPQIKECNCITIIIDLVYTNHIVKEIIKLLKNNYPELSTLNVCSIFYSDNCKFNADESRESNFRQEIYDGVSINFHFISKVELNKCPYNKENGLTVQDCMIYMNQLDTVHKLYENDEM